MWIRRNAGRRGAGAVDRGGLENRCTLCGYRGFESLPLRQNPISRHPRTFQTTAESGSFSRFSIASRFSLPPTAHCGNVGKVVDLAEGVRQAKQVGRLTDAAIRGSLKPGMHPDGDGLYLQARGSSKAWIFRYAVAGRPRSLGLGGYPVTSLASARKARDSAREKVRAGGDPIAEKRPAGSEKPAAITFREAVDDSISARWSADGETRGNFSLPPAPPAPPRHSAAAWTRRHP